MKTVNLTIRLESELAKALERMSRETRKSRSEIVRNALRRHVRLARFEAIRKRLMPFAEAKGILTDEDVFAIVS